MRDRGFRVRQTLPDVNGKATAASERRDSPVGLVGDNQSFSDVVLRHLGLVSSPAEGPVAVKGDPRYFRTKPPPGFRQRRY